MHVWVAYKLPKAMAPLEPFSDSVILMLQSSQPFELQLDYMTWGFFYEEESTEIEREEDCIKGRKETCLKVIYYHKYYKNWLYNLAAEIDWKMFIWFYQKSILYSQNCQFSYFYVNQPFSLILFSLNIKNIGSFSKIAEIWSTALTVHYAHQQKNCKHPTVFIIIPWVAGLLGQMTHWPSVWCSK